MPVVDQHPELSVVVCTNREPERLARSLEALRAQTIWERMEVVVVDDGAPAPLASVCGDFGAVLIEHPANLGLAAARNTGWQAAKAPVVAFTDDDCRPEPEWAEVLLGAYEDPSVVGAGGEVRCCGVRGLLERYYALRPPIAPLEADLALGVSPGQRLKLYLLGNVRGGVRSGRREVASLPGASMSVRRCALETLEGFDPAIHFGGEDEDFFFRLRHRFPGAKLVVLPSAVTEHDFSGGIRDMLRRARSYGRGNARNFVKHPAWGPTIFPVPFASLALALLGLTGAGGRRRQWLAAAAMLPAAAFPRWSLEALRRKNAAMSLLAWVQLLEEAASDIGFASGYLGARREIGSVE